MVCPCQTKWKIRFARIENLIEWSLQQAFAGVPLVEGDLFGGVAAGLVVDLSGR
jgi:hypothetical protein